MSPQVCFFFFFFFFSARMGIFILATGTSIVTILGCCSSGYHNSSRVSAYFMKMIFTAGSSSFTCLSTRPHSPPTLCQGRAVSALSFDLFSVHNVLYLAGFSDIFILAVFHQNERKNKVLFLMFFQKGCIPPKMCSSSFYCLVSSRHLL